MNHEEMLKLVKASQGWEDAADWKDNCYLLERLLDEVPGLLELVDYATKLTAAAGNLVGLLQGEFDLRDIDASAKRIIDLMDTQVLGVVSKQFNTWDEVVECSDDISGRQRSLIESLGYYGKEIKTGDVEKILTGVAHSFDKPYAVTYSGVDGSCTESFDDLEVAGEYVKDRYQYWKGEDGFGSDYANYSLHGFTMSEIGLERRE